MKSITLRVVFGAFALLSSLSAPCQDSRFYFKGDLGGNFTQDTDLSVKYSSPSGSLGNGASNSKAHFDPGGRIGLAVGYSMSDWLAAEAELGATVNTFGGRGVIDGTLAHVPLLFNLRLEYPNHSRWTPFIGAGLGVSASIVDSDILLASPSFDTFVRVHVNEAEAVFAYQAFAGLRYRLNGRIGLSLEYRYFAADGPESHSAFPFFGHATAAFGTIQTHALSAAFDYHF